MSSPSPWLSGARLRTYASRVFRTVLVLALCFVVSGLAEAATRHQRNRKKAAPAVRDVGTAARSVDVAPPYVPSLDAIMLDMQRPLPEMDEWDDKALQVLGQRPQLDGNVKAGSFGNGMALLWCLILLMLGWYLRGASGMIAVPAAWPASLRSFRGTAGEQLGRFWSRIYRPRVRASPPETTEIRMPIEPEPAAPPPVNYEALSAREIVAFKALNDFESWIELLTAARCGNRVAREVLRSSPAHHALKFSLTADEFKVQLAGTRCLEFSKAWVGHILSVLRRTEILDERIVVTSPLGQQHHITLDADVGMLNAVLGYETVPAKMRAQLELRRWILMHTKLDGMEDPGVLSTFRTRGSVFARAAV